MGVRLLIAGDHTISQAVISSWLGGLPGIEIIGVAGTSRIAVDLARLLHADVVLIDAAMVRRTGMEILHRAFQTMPGLRVLVLSDDADACSGPSNHPSEIGQRVSRDCSLNDLAKAIHEAYAGAGATTS